MNVVPKIISAILGSAAVGVLAACGVQSAGVPLAVPNQTTQVTTTTATPAPQTVYVVPTTRTVYVQPQTYSTPASEQWYAQPSWINSQPWITITPDAGQTDCQWLYANGYTYPEAFAAWAQRDYPVNWSATNDGYPCQRTYGMQH